MKNSLITGLALLLAFSSCKKHDSLAELTQTRSTGPQTEKTITESFDAIEVTTGISAEIVKSDAEKAVVSAPSDVLKDVEMSVKSGTLIIRIKPGIRFKNIDGITAKIFAKDFNSVEANSGASITIRDKFLQDKTDISASSAGSIEGNLEANNMSIDASSGGSFSGKVWAIDLNSDSSSSGSVNISGKTKNLVAGASSGGSLEAKDLTAESAELDASSGGSITVGVSKSLTTDASSGGSISYIKRGELQEKNVNATSGGSVQETK